MKTCMKTGCRFVCKLLPLGVGYAYTHLYLVAEFVSLLKMVHALVRFPTTINQEAISVIANSRHGLERIVRFQKIDGKPPTYGDQCSVPVLATCLYKLPF
jgi:hypothetical protein